MVLSYKFAGIVGVLIFFLIWLVLYLHKKSLRKEMIIMGLITLPLGPISEIFYIRDYWHPQYLINIFGFGLEDLLFAFFIGGIGAVIYEEFFIKRIREGKREHSWITMLLAGIIIIISFILNLYLKINSIYLSSIVMVLIGLIILIQRNDLLKNAIGNGILVALVMLVFYVIWTFIFPGIIQGWWKLENISGIIQGWWKLENISGIIILGAPLEELMWGFAWGFLAGPIYEYWRDLYND